MSSQRVDRLLISHMSLWILHISEVKRWESIQLHMEAKIMEILLLDTTGSYSIKQSCFLFISVISCLADSSFQIPKLLHTNKTVVYGSNLS